MLFQSVPDTAMFTAKFIGPDGTAPSFSLYSRNTLAAWGATQLTLIADAFRDAIVDSYLPLLSTDTTFERVISRDLEPEFGRVIEHDPVNEAGTLASPSLPANVAVCCTFIGDPGAPPARGRIFLPPPAESQIVGSLISVGPLGDLQDAAEALHNAMSASGPAHVIVSRYSGSTLVDMPDGQKIKKPSKRAVGLTNTVPTVIVHNRVDSQRKRRPRE